MSSVTKAQRDRAHRLGTLAGRAGRGLGGACPYNANGTPSERQLAAVFVRAFIAAGGQVDGLDYGDGTTLDTTEPAGRPDGYRGGHRGGGPGSHRAYGHLGMPL